MNNFKIIGGILLILGTSIGAGMLALPIASAGEGFITSSLMLLATWVAMTFGALLILEVNLWLPENSNLISMAGATLGKVGKAIAWLSYLMLLYAVLCAYVSGNSDVLQGLVRLVHINIPRTLSSILVVAIFGAIVYRGIYSVDIVNRLLMSSKIILYFILVVLIAPHIELPQLATYSSKIQLDTITVMITSFAFATILPSLRVYFKSDVAKLRLVILLGSLIPLIFYILWIAIVHGVLNTNELNNLVDSKNTVTDLTNLLIYKSHVNWMSIGIRGFISICAATSFLGVALSMCDFLADGLKINKYSKNGMWIYILTFVPPLLIVIAAPSIFVKALSYAGIFCIILFLLLPSLMAWQGRYGKNSISQGKFSYQVIGGKIFLGAEIALAAGLLLWKIFS